MGHLLGVGFLCATAWMMIVHGGIVTTKWWTKQQAHRYARHVYEKDVASLKREDVLQEAEQDIYRLLFQRRGLNAPRYQGIVRRYRKARSRVIFLVIGATWLVLTATDESRVGTGWSATWYVLIGAVLILGLLQLMNAGEWVWSRRSEKRHERLDKKMKTYLDPQMRHDVEPIAFQDLLNPAEWRWAVRFADNRGIASLDSEKPAVYPPYFTRSGAYLLQYTTICDQWASFLKWRGENLPTWFDKDLTRPTPPMPKGLSEEERLLHDVRTTFEREIEDRLKMVGLVNASGKGIDAMLRQPYDVAERYFSEK